MNTHDFTDRSWGHDYTISAIYNDGIDIDAAGWGLGIKKDDYLILRENYRTTRYQVLEIEYRSDPRDMWFAKLRFAPRENNVNVP
jgi:hypothetical protein